jgi:hypothetical protein
MTIPKPECQLGYPESQLKEILGDRLEDFNLWMRGQTIAGCDGRRYDHDKKEYQPTGCGPHGYVIYSWDLERYLAGGFPID